LDLSKIESGKLTILQTPFDLHALLGTVMQMFGPQAEAKGLRLLSQISPETPYALVGDPGHLRQVLINLVGNAVKFTEAGSVSLRCHPLRDTSGRVLIRFQVVDTGIGIPSMLIPHLRQVHPSGSGPYPALRRHRTRNHHFQESGGTDGWTHRCRQYPWDRDQLLVRPGIRPPGER